MKNKLLFSFILLAVSFILRYLSGIFLTGNVNYFEHWLLIVATFILGAWVLRGAADIIEETTEVLSEKTGVAGGVLQAFGTAFPDMVLGIVAAIISLSFKTTDYLSAVNYAIIAAATTFGSNVYNVIFSAWLIFRQNLANNLGRDVATFPFAKSKVIPMIRHIEKPTHKEMDTAVSIITMLSVLTSIVALSMVFFGKVQDVPSGINDDLYQLVRPVGFLILVVGAVMIYIFRKSERRAEIQRERAEFQGYFHRHPVLIIWLGLLIASIAILFSAQAIIHALKVFSDITRVPFVLTGVGAGIVGSLGEMIVVYKFTVNPRGRIGDAIVGVAMDNIVTIIGASIVAIIGGIFLGGPALILIFVVTLCVNTILIWQISRLKDHLPFS